MKKPTKKVVVQTIEEKIANLQDRIKYLEDYVEIQQNTFMRVLEQVKKYRHQ